MFITKLSNNAIMDVSTKLRSSGHLELQDDYCYLNIDDDYIHQIYPLLSSYGNIKKPDYFDALIGVGAHISVIYPDEGITRFNLDSMIHGFSVIQFAKVRFQLETYYVLIVDAPSLQQVRRKHQLAPKPTFKKQNILFHITLGVEA